jgi:hypothetical protein
LFNASNSTLGNLSQTVATTVTVESPNWLVLLFTSFLPTIFVRLWDILLAPVRIPQMQWVIIPILVTFIVTETYFFRNVDEELSWNAALVNGLILLFVAIELTKVLFDYASPGAVFKLFIETLQTGEELGAFSVVLFLALLGLVIALIMFFHLLPKGIAYKVAGHVPVTFITYTAVVLVYSAKYGEAIPLDSATVIAVAILTTLVLFVMFTIQRAPGLKAIQRIRGGD